MHKIKNPLLNDSKGQTLKLFHDSFSHFLHRTFGHWNAFDKIGKH